MRFPIFSVKCPGSMRVSQDGFQPAQGGQRSRLMMMLWYDGARTSVELKSLHSMWNGRPAWLSSAAGFTRKTGTRVSSDPTSLS